MPRILWHTASTQLKLAISFLFTVAILHWDVGTRSVDRGLGGFYPRRGTSFCLVLCSPASRTGPGWRSCQASAHWAGIFPTWAECSGRFTLANPWLSLEPSWHHRLQMLSGGAIGLPRAYLEEPMWRYAGGESVLLCWPEVEGRCSPWAPCLPAAP